MSAAGSSWAGAPGGNPVYSPAPVPVAKPPLIAILEQRQIQDLTERLALLKESAAAREAKEGSCQCSR